MPQPCQCRAILQRKGLFHKVGWIVDPCHGNIRSIRLVVTVHHVSCHTDHIVGLPEPHTGRSHVDHDYFIDTLFQKALRRPVHVVALWIAFCPRPAVSFTTAVSQMRSAVDLGFIQYGIANARSLFGFCPLFTY